MEKNKTAPKAPPTLRYDFYLEKIGYEVQVFVDGKPVGFECRDFGGNHPVRKLAKDLNRRILKVTEKFRISH